MASKKVVVLPGDDAAPETVGAAMEVLRALGPDIEYVEFPPGEQWVRSKTAIDARAAIDASDSTLFGSTSGKTAGIIYLRWGKHTYANVRPARYIPGSRSPLKHPDGIDYVIVRENLEDLYLGLEGPLEALAPLKLHSRIAARARSTPRCRATSRSKSSPSATASGSRSSRVELARKRKAAGGKGKVTCTSKYNMLRESDELFRRIAEDISAGYPDIKYEQFIIDDFARRMVQSPHDLDVVVMPNLYGDIMSDAAAGTFGGLGARSERMLRRRLCLLRVGARHRARHRGTEHHQSDRDDALGRDDAGVPGFRAEPRSASTRRAQGLRRGPRADARPGRTFEHPEFTRAVLANL